MILGVGVDPPEIVLFAIHDISDRQHGRQHGMVLIVVPVSVDCASPPMTIYTDGRTPVTSNRG